MTHNDQVVRFLNPETMPKPPGFTQVVEVSGGRTVYVSGQIARSPEGELVGVGDPLQQAEQVFANINAGLSAVGATFHDVIKLTYYLVDVADFAAVRQVRDKYINPENPPASTAVGITGLVNPENVIEIEAIAVIREQKA